MSKKAKETNFIDKDDAWFLEGIRTGNFHFRADKFIFKLIINITLLVGCSFLLFYLIH